MLNKIGAPKWKINSWFDAKKERAANNLLFPLYMFCYDFRWEDIINFQNAQMIFYILRILGENIGIQENPKIFESTAIYHFFIVIFSAKLGQGII